jgi:hypothetical protein
MAPSTVLGDVYEIRVKGHLDPHWETRFEDLRLRMDISGETVLSGVFRDQAALYGLLSWLRDLGVPLLLVRRIDAPGAAAADSATGYEARHPESAGGLG